jgi:hypothetical protein
MSSSARTDIEALDLRTAERVKRLRAELRALNPDSSDYAVADPAHLSGQIQQARLEGIWDGLYALAARIDRLTAEGSQKPGPAEQRSAPTSAIRSPEE